MLFLRSGTLIGRYDGQTQATYTVDVTSYSKSVSDYYYKLVNIHNYAICQRYSGVSALNKRLDVSAIPTLSLSGNILTISNMQADGVNQSRSGQSTNLEHNRLEYVIDLYVK